MSTGALSNLRFNPCRLLLNPTQNPSGNTYPFGATEIGFLQALAVEDEHAVAVEIWEEYAQAEGAHGVTRRKVRVACSLRGWDKNAIDALPQGTIVSSADGKIDVVVTDYIDGTKLAGVKLLVVPDSVAKGDEAVADCDEVAVALYDAVMLKKASAKAELGYGKQFGWPIVFVARPDSNGRIIQETPLRRITGFA